jgi:anthranilate phosphoribosyltransferase
MPGQERQSVTMGELKYGDVLRSIIAGNHLDRSRSHWAFSQIMDGLWSEAQVSGLLVALAAKGETAEEITGAAEAMRQRAARIDNGGADVIDTCGTGGTGLSTFNISTAAALVCAGAGVKVAKHGNRTNTRASGSADVLAALGVNIDAPAETAARCLAEAGVCFCFAVRCHPAMKHAMPVRKALAVRTIFNVLGPLTNPAGARRQLMGVFDAKLTETMARVLGALGAIRATVVHAEDGLDELSTTAPTRLADLRDGQVSVRTVRPEDFGFKRGSLSNLMVASAQESAEVIRAVLAGEKGPARDIVVLNAAAALAVADKAPDIASAIPAARDSIDSGAAAVALETLISVSNR